MKYLFLITGLFLFDISLAQEIYEVDVEVRENSFVVNNTAVDMISKGNYTTAAKILEKVIEDDPSYHAAYLNFYRAGSQVEEKKEKVVQVLRKGLEIFQEDDEMAYYLGNLLQRENRYNEAIEAYSEAIAYSKINGEDFPLVWAYYFNRGNCYLKTNQFKKAIQDYNYALTLSPDNADVLTNRGFCYYKTNDSDAACTDWHAALNLGNSQTSRYIQSFCQ
ncbi:tetratricopeptide repeat protein [Cecembia lonarensis]|uniref:Putative O-linked N-acetylglucosamine transferase, SPINDLY family n=1 Tax=Cecembia lonarensis (strain CCUG 58316 / KCTC 22772 / LW9) TaxID=1225176 RepID=K1L1W2_CECL9|nr:tetratricopeptide repeat protein [Cecembia lonarensis]EKB48736.1 putative O-linked N-acetylglucosamine transferase, SPINDLY family [Cecembia lonarensis LW9]